ncbi:RidA family protein [Pseudodesulfovibrio sp.]|nr:RidA family protein [Pseudodesulfovibrio sp.]
MKSISSPDCPAPAGHYSQGTLHNGILYVSGMLPLAKDGEKKLGSIEEQTLQALENCEAVIKAAGASRKHVLKCTCYISDIELWGRVNEVYAEFFGDHKPARAVVPTKELHFGFQIEIDCVAVVETWA